MEAVSNEMLLAILGIVAVNLFVWFRVVRKGREPLSAEVLVGATAAPAPAASTPTTAGGQQEASSNSSPRTDAPEPTTKNAEDGQKDDAVAGNPETAPSTAPGPAARPVRAVVPADGAEGTTSPAAPRPANVPSSTKLSRRDMYLQKAKGQQQSSPPPQHQHEQSRTATETVPAPALAKSELEPPARNGTKKLSRREQYLRQAQSREQKQTQQKKAVMMPSKDEDDDLSAAAPVASDAAKAESNRAGSARDRYLQRQATEAGAGNSDAGNKSIEKEDPSPALHSSSTATPASSSGTEATPVPPAGLSKRERYLQQQRAKATKAKSASAATPTLTFGAMEAVEGGEGGETQFSSATTNHKQEGSVGAGAKDTEHAPSAAAQPTESVEETLNRQFPNRQRSRLQYLQRSSAAKRVESASAPGVTRSATAPSTHVQPSQNQSYDSLLLRRARSQKRRTQAQPKASSVPADDRSEPTPPPVSRTASTRDLYFSKSAPALQQRASSVPLHLEPSRVKSVRRQQLLQNAQRKQQAKFVEKQSAFREAWRKERSSQLQEPGDEPQNSDAAHGDTKVADETDALLDDLDFDDLLADVGDSPAPAPAASASSEHPDAALARLLDTMFADADRGAARAVLPAAAGADSAMQLQWVEALRDDRLKMVTASQQSTPLSRGYLAGSRLRQR
eukprot:INCI14324.1.p1 GENE.INCI14324.1~~INCI14324.1.p1  ORF type:complete len:678 (+),score=134.21 INCI14324.1:183-2216(+)